MRLSARIARLETRNRPARVALNKTKDRTMNMTLKRIVIWKSLRQVVFGICAAALIAAVSPEVMSQQAKKADPKQAETKSLDKVTLRDGRTFEGRVLEESEASVTMEVVVAGIKTKLTWPRSDVLELKRSVVKETIETPVAPATGAGAAESETSEAEDTRRLIDVIPIRGELGYDAHETEIKRMWDEAMEAGTKTVILNFDGLYCLLYELDEYRDTFQDIKDEADEKNVEVVAWATGSNLGSAVAFVMMFENIYSHPDSIMGRGEAISQFLKDRFPDEKVQAKMISAWTSHLKGMAEEGGHDSLLCEAMIRPELELSMSFVDGQAVFYRENAGGNVHKMTGSTIIDPSNEVAVAMTGDQAVQWGVSLGLASTVENLIEGKLGYREYRLFKDGKTRDESDAWVNGWAGGIREPGEGPRGGAALKLQNLMQDIAQVQGWDMEPTKKIGKQIQIWEEVLSLVRKWPPLAKGPYGMNIDEVQFQIDQLRKQARDLRNRDDG